MPTDGFSTLLGDTLAFLHDLSANNNREWFTAHKQTYERDVRRPALLFLDDIAARLERRTGIAVTPKLYRIHRDLRFAKDKTPYNSHLHLQWTAAQGAPVAWLFGLSESYFCAGLGIMGFSPAQVAAWRAAVAGPAGAALAADLAGLLSADHRIDPPELTRVPPPHARDHARGDLLRRKSLVVWRDFGADAAADPATALSEAFRDLDPVRALLDRIFAKA